MQSTSANLADRSARPGRPPRTARPAAPLTTARLCAAAPATRGMLRLYEREGLIRPPQRSASGYRHYAQDTVDRVRAIRLLKDLGLSLREIGLLLSESDTDCLDADRMRALAGAQLQQIDARMARLALLRSYLAPLAAGDFGVLDQDADCRFLADFLAAAPVGAEARA
ncbi:MerR family transcriptional regulator [Pseudaquabacterium pictum]|uniref:HTH merR-type domain-containing protein n=1 Tax=Pseudaquabacterium pictum TaxID=2315236 RepID=A0A480ARN9_9BURK|nr:MerR family transcriptional regulator [Rubrivivax pictus]GCL62702.1 hypothetical protein AQPW35_17830 [Rubrivivax pictus]